jgi:hypothetical protein
MAHLGTPSVDAAAARGPASRASYYAYWRFT